VPACLPISASLNAFTPSLGWLSEHLPAWLGIPLLADPASSRASWITSKQEQGVMNKRATVFYVFASISGATLQKGLTISEPDANRTAMMERIQNYSFMQKDRPVVVMIYANDVYRQLVLQSLCWLQVPVARRSGLEESQENGACSSRGPTIWRECAESILGQGTWMRVALFADEWGCSVGPNCG
jgi:hypothetical protein